MADYVSLDVVVKGKTHKVKLEKGIIFENNTKTYKVKKDGTLSIFDKGSGKWKTGSSINMTNYQYQIFKAVADNVDENGPKKKGLILSWKDIKYAFNMFSKGKLTKDLSKTLPQGYALERPNVYRDNKTLEVGVVDEVNNTSAAKLFFHYGNKSILPTSEVDSTKKEDSNTKPTSNVHGKNLFPNKNVVRTASKVHTIKSGEDLVSIAVKYGVDTYTLVAVNPQLKQGADYTLTKGRDGNLVLNTVKGHNFKTGAKINIPEKYSVKPGSVKTLDDVEKITGVSPSYVEKVLKEMEGYSAYVYDDYDSKKRRLKPGDKVSGTRTIGYGHIGKVDGKTLAQLVKAGNKNLPKEKIYEILINDILEHKQRAIAYFGDSYLKAPKSVQDTILDIVFNRGIFDGFMNPLYSKNTKFIKNDLEKGHYASALAHSAKSGNAYRGLYRRSVLRFLHGLRDLSADKRKAAMEAFEPEYKLSLSKMQYKWEKDQLRNGWEKAKKGVFIY